MSIIILKHSQRIFIGKSRSVPIWQALVSCDHLEHIGERTRLIDTSSAKKAQGTTCCLRCSFLFRKGRIPANKGIPRSDETKRKIGEKVRAAHQIRIKNRELTNLKVNKLTVIRQYKIPPFNRTRVDCLCECGNKVTTDLSKVTSGHTKSCGCIRNGTPRISLRKGFGESSANKVFDSYKRNAKNKNFSFLITKEEAMFLFKQRCFYCNTEPQNTFHQQGSYGSFTYNGIDRLDNSIGYEKENCVTCCTKCNYQKNKLSLSEFSNWIYTVYKNLSNRGIIVERVPVT